MGGRGFSSTDQTEYPIINLWPVLGLSITISGSDMGFIFIMDLDSRGVSLPALRATIITIVGFQH